MLEFRIHGRGGQGSVAAAYLLAETAFHDGQMCQAFPAFGAERRGAPVTAFVRSSHRPIRMRSQVRTPHYLIVQDGTLLSDRAITAGLREGGGMVVNTARASEEVSEEFNCKAHCLPASKLAIAALGRPIPNTALLAAFLTLTGLFPLQALERALRSRFAGDVLDGNLKLIETVAGQTERDAWKEREDA